MKEQSSSILSVLFQDKLGVLTGEYRSNSEGNIRFLRLKPNKLKDKYFDIDIKEGLLVSMEVPTQDVSNRVFYFENIKTGTKHVSGTLSLRPELPTYGNFILRMDTPEINFNEINGES